MIRIGILISGRGSNMDAILAALKTGQIRNAIACVVISNNPESNGLTIASEKYNIPAVAIPSGGLKGWDYDEKVVTVLQNHGVSPESGLVCLAGYMRILSPRFVKLYRMRILNIHPALLPSFPGLGAQKQALEYGVKVTGCTVHFVDEGIDSGPILMQKEVPVLDGDNEESLSARILEQEHLIYPKAVEVFCEGRLEIKDRVVSLSRPSPGPNVV
ncbi:MAG TPA: phosphoribosylglycinamide formyltransferase [Nitrososphaera sp.]